MRRHEDEILLVVANLSRFVEFVELDLRPWKGTVPVELFGRRALPPVDEAPYPLTLAGHGFYWFSLSPRARDEARAAAYEPPVLEAAAWPALPGAEHAAALAEVLAGWTAAQAWFAGRRRRVETARLADAAPVGEPSGAYLVVLEISYEEGDAERYLVAPAVADGAHAAESPRPVAARGGGLAARRAGARLGGQDAHRGAGERGALRRARGRGSARVLLETLFERRRIEGRSGIYLARASVPRTVSSRARRARPRRRRGAMVLFGERFFVDVTRRLDDGASPGLGLDRFLAERGASAPVPPLAGAVEYAAPRAEPVALAVLRTFVPSESDGFAHTVAEAHRFFERVLARGEDEPLPPPEAWDVARLIAEEPPPLVRDAVGAFLDTARLLGRRTAELHRALTGPLPAFAPEPYSPLDQRGAYQSMRNLAGRCLRELGRSARFLPPEVAPLAARVLGRQDEALRRFGALLGRRLTAPRTRHLGALDLRKVLLTGNDLLFADLEGGPDAAGGGAPPQGVAAPRTWPGSAARSTRRRSRRSSIRPGCAPRTWARRAPGPTRSGRGRCPRSSTRTWRRREGTDSSAGCPASSACSSTRSSWTAPSARWQPSSPHRPSPGDRPWRWRSSQRSWGRGGRVRSSRTRRIASREAPDSRIGDFAPGDRNTPSRRRCSGAESGAPRASGGISPCLT